MRFLYKSTKTSSLFVWLVADGWCWFVLREKYCWLVAGGWFALREKYCWLVADKPSEQAVASFSHRYITVSKLARRRKSSSHSTLLLFPPLRNVSSKTSKTFQI
jgi:hypothetical protein